MDELRCVVEPRSGPDGDLAERIADAIHRELGVRCAVETVTPGSLPRFDMKARRLVRKGEATEG
jgi:phenylacetate-coenzyme A ligase PaaK-like adenylate-forming protein